MTADRRTIRDLLTDFIRQPDARFPELALALFNYQFESNAPYRAYCGALGAGPGSVSSWEEIPPVPADAFKARHPLTCFPSAEAERIFLTSGTTTEERGRHYFRETGTYRLSILEGWSCADLPVAPRRLFLSRHPRQMPESSLAFMFETLAADRPDAEWLPDDDAGLRRSVMEAVRTSREPVLLLGTALAILELCEAEEPPPALPPGSGVFQTGGYKGLRREFAAGEVHGLIRNVLDVPGERVINEYGMTELSSQCYALGEGAPHLAPPWLRVRSIHPETGKTQPPGEPGYLVFYDLANIDSVLAVRTQDFGSVIDHSSFVLHGRDPGALPRGCSRSSPSPRLPARRP